MPLLEFTQTRHFNVGLRFSDSTVQRVNRYVAYIKSRTGIQIEANQAIEKNLHLGFDKDREFVDFEKSAEAQNVPSVLRVRKAPAADAAAARPKPPAKAVEAQPLVAGSRA